MIYGEIGTSVHVLPNVRKFLPDYRKVILIVNAMTTFVATPDLSHKTFSVLLRHIRQALHKSRIMKTLGR
jgi:hypothetical protein